MNKLLLPLVILFSTASICHAQIDTNSTHSNQNGDIQLRRFSAGDTSWKKALVVGFDSANNNSRLYLNYEKDFNEGVRIGGPIVDIDGNLGVGTHTPSERLHVNGGAIIRKASFGRTIQSHENSWVRDDWLTGNLGAPVWDQSKERWIRPLGTYNDFGGIVWQDEGVYFIKQGQGTKTEFTNDEMLQSAFLFASTWSKNIGIGTTSPDQKLTVQGSVNIGGTGNSTLRVRHIEGKNHENTNYDNLFLNYHEGNDVYIGNFWNESIRKANLFVTGNVGVGIINPAEKLAVNGNIRAKEVKVELENWPDYVFERDYALPSLSEVKNFIEQHGHLPDIPNAKEIQQQGASLGELNVKLLQKIEELTLYTLDQEARLLKQQKLIEKQSELLSQIITQIECHENPTP